MRTTADRLDTAAFPEDYADILIETLGITAANYLNVKDALDRYRRLDDDQATEVMRRIAEHEDFAGHAPPSDDPPPPLKLTRELAERMFNPSHDVVYGPHSFYSAEDDREVQWTHPDERYVITFDRAAETFTGHYYAWDDEEQDWVDTVPMTAEQIRECIERNRLLFAR